MKNNVSVIGGDTRQLFAGKYLADKGYNVSFFACEHGKINADLKHSANQDEINKSDIIIFEYINGYFLFLVLLMVRNTLLLRKSCTK